MASYRGTEAAGKRTAQEKTGGNHDIKKDVHDTEKLHAHPFSLKVFSFLFEENE